MQKLLFATVALATLSLPGCIFAIGTDEWDDGGETGCCADCPQMNHAEKRLSVIEHHLKGDCKTDCSLCAKAEKHEKSGEKTEAAK